MNRLVCARLLVLVIFAFSSFALLTACPPAGAEGGNWPPVGQLAGGLPEAVAIQGDYAYVGGGAFTVVDISLPDQPRQVGCCATPYYTHGVAVAGSYAYVAAWDAGLRVIDVSNPALPVEVAHYTGPVDASGVAVAGSYAYVADYGDGGLQVLDVSDPANPVQVGWCDAPDRASGVTVAGSYAYLAEGNAGLRVIDISNPALPVEVGSWDTPGYARGVAVAGSYAYVADWGGGLRVIDVSNPALPVEVGYRDTPGDAYGVAVAGSYSYVADQYAGLRVIDVSSPALPVEVGSWATPGNAYGVAVAGSYAYVAAWGAGLRVIDVSNPALPVEAGYWATAGSARGVAVAGSYAYVAAWDAGLRVIDVSNPALPAEVGSWAPVGYANGVAVAGSYAYVADDTGVLRVIDVSNPASPVEVGSWAVAGNAYAVAVAGSYAYVGVWGACLHVIDVSNPALPVEVGDCATPGTAMGVAVAGSYAYVADYSAGLRVVDVSNPASPVEVGYCFTPGMAYGVAVAGSYAYVAAYTGGLSVIDVSNPALPVEVTGWDTPGFAYGVAVAGGYAYLTDYGMGLTIFTEVPPPGAISGQVRVRGTTTNIAGATVEARLGGVLKGSATTATNGVYSITGLVPDAYVVSAHKTGYVTQTKAGVTVKSYETSYCNLWLEESGRIMGQVRRKGTTTNLYGATVVASLNGKVRATGTTAANGIYLLDTELPTGTYVVSASEYGYLTQTKANVNVTQGMATYVNFNLDRICLHGYVTQQSTTTNLTGATVKVYQGDVLMATAITDNDGIYEFGGLPVGSYTCVASKTGYVRQIKINIPVTEGGVTGTNFDLAVSGKLRGQVKDKISGANLIGATVVARMGGVIRASAVTTAPYGVYEIASDLPAGSNYVVTASKAGYVLQTKGPVTVTAGATTYVNFFLDKTCLMGQVRQAGTSTNLAGAAVAAYDGATLKATATADANGIYQIGGLSTGTYTVIGSKTGYVKQTKPGIAVTAGVATYVNFALAVSGKLKGQVTNKVGGAPIIGATITARTGGVVWATGTTVGPYGIYEIASDLPAGTYSVLCQRSGYQDFGRIGIVVNAGVTTYVNFPLSNSAK